MKRTVAQVVEIVLVPILGSIVGAEVVHVQSQGRDSILNPKITQIDLIIRAQAATAELQTTKVSHHIAPRVVLEATQPMPAAPSLNQRTAGFDIVVTKICHMSLTFLDTSTKYVT